MARTPCATRTRAAAVRGQLLRAADDTIIATMSSDLSQEATLA